MPSYFPENNTPLPQDSGEKSLQKINDLLVDGISVVVGELEIKNNEGDPVTVDGTVTANAFGVDITNSIAHPIPLSDSGEAVVVDVRGGFGQANVPISGTVTANVAVGSNGELTVSTFTSTASATLKADNSSRKLLTIFNEGAGNLHILYGAGTASTTNYSVRLSTGDYLEIDKYTGQVNAIFATAGTARVTEIT